MSGKAEEPKVVVEPKEVVVEGDEPKTEEGKYYTQPELDKMFEKRVARVKNEKPADYEDLLAIASDLEAF